MNLATADVHAQKSNRKNHSIQIDSKLKVKQINAECECDLERRTSTTIAAVLDSAHGGRPPTGCHDRDLN